MLEGWTSFNAHVMHPPPQLLSLTHTGNINTHTLVAGDEEEGEDSEPSASYNKLLMPGMESYGTLYKH